jgi:hypothetical protein
MTVLGIDESVTSKVVPGRAAGVLEIVAESLPRSCASGSLGRRDVRGRGLGLAAEAVVVGVEPVGI